MTATLTEAGTSGKQRLMDAARSLFSSGAYAEVSVGQVLQLAGVHAPTLYHHYGDKEGLYVAWAMDAFERLGSSIMERLPDGGSMEEQLEAYAAALIASPDVDLYGTIREAKRLSSPESGEQVLNAYFENVFEPLCGVIIEGIDKGDIAAGPVDRLAELFIGGAVVFAGALGRHPGSSRDAAWLVERYLGGVR